MWRCQKSIDTHWWYFLHAERRCYLCLLCFKKNYLVLQERSVPALRPHHCVLRLQSSRQEMSHLQGLFKTSPVVGVSERSGFETDASLTCKAQPTGSGSQHLTSVWRSDLDPGIAITPKVEFFTLYIFFFIFFIVYPYLEKLVDFI